MNFSWQCTDDYFSIEFEKDLPSLSSAVYNGGFRNIRSFLNLRVKENYNGEQADFPSPRETLERRISEVCLPQPAAGMMTAASMNSFQYASRSLGDIHVYCFLTSGLSNALAAGDPGDFMPQQMFRTAAESRLGTINIASGTNISLSEQALAEALMVVTEAKSSVLFELGVKSKISNRAATGTGTDSAVIFSGGEGEPEEFCGKHTVLGEMLASAVRTALFESLKGDRLFAPC